MDAVPQFDRVWGLLYDEEGNTITWMGRARVGSLGLVLFSDARQS